MSATSSSESYLTTEELSTSFGSVSETTPFTLLSNGSVDAMAEAVSQHARLKQSKGQEDARTITHCRSKENLGHLRRYFLGHCSKLQAEQGTTTPATFRIYKKVRPYPDVDDTAVLTMVHRRYNGEVCHYPIKEKNDAVFVEVGGRPQKEFGSIYALIDYYNREYLIVDGVADVFIDLSDAESGSFVEDDGRQELAS